ncbi:MAG: 3-hydroxyacyl-CoA dehydrogenase/enoyl-CoA hydratase family protein [Anaerolineales bacterium]|nr:3-hydroxyacyl-CoA dehydrogenase/enoyl-CoA hydratase family protein [Anaerolineales bacterium]
MRYQIRKAAVIGGGTMGGGIAALLSGIGIPTLILDIVPNKLTPAETAAGLTLQDKEVRNRIVEAGWKSVAKAKPPSVLSQESVRLISLGNLNDDFDKLADADWIIEAVIEKLDIKQSLFARIEAIRKPTAIVSSNTSGLPIHAMAEGRGKAFQEHFLGTHFFNPPRWLKLLEIIPQPNTLPEVLQFMIAFGEDVLGKGVVVCKDTPNFIGNRLASIGGSQALAYALDHDYTAEEVDSLTGELIGHPNTATFRLNDLIGLDVVHHVSSNLYDLVPQDEAREVLRHPGASKLMGTMLERKWLGNKTDVGFSKKVVSEKGEREFWVLNLKTLEHEPPKKPRFKLVGEARKMESLPERIRWLMDRAFDAEAPEEDRRLARYLWATTAYALAYASRRIPEIADDFTSVDNTVRWGFMHELGPFEIWDALGVAQTVERMQADGLVVAPWVNEMLAAGCATFYQQQDGRTVGAYSRTKKAYVPLAADPRKLKLDVIKSRPGAVLKDNMSASLVDMGDRVGLVEFHSKANSLDQDIFDMLVTALDEAEAGRFDALVIGNEGKHFCAGANVFVMWMASQQGDFDQVDTMIRALQGILMRVRYFPKPIVAAPFGMVLGGGAEVSMACSRRVAAAETFIGLVETGSVGVIPAGTGTKEMLRRVVNPVMRIPSADPISVMQKVFEQIATAKVATGAQEAFEFGFFGPGDRIVMNRDHLLAEAKRSALALVAEGYHPPAPEMIYAAGRDVLAALRAAIWGLEQAGWATKHDAVVAGKLAWLMCGGDLTEPTWVPEQYMLDLERKVFIELCHEPKTLERMAHLLQYNKPLRN